MEELATQIRVANAMTLSSIWRYVKQCPTNFSLSLEFGYFSPRSGRECVAQGKSAQPWVSMRLLTVSPRSGRQKKLQIRDVRAAAAARCAGLAANVPTFPGLRRLALGYTLSPATRVPPTPVGGPTNFSLSICRTI